MFTIHQLFSQEWCFLWFLNLKPPEMLVVNAGHQFAFWDCSGFMVRGFNNRLHLTFTWTQTAYIEETWMPVQSECCQKETSAVWLLTLNFGRTTVLWAISGFFFFVGFFCFSFCLLCVAIYRLLTLHMVVYLNSHKIKQRSFLLKLEANEDFIFCHACLAVQRWTPC